jgi:squalene-hopene/tetraprenyl-beta-curcumene cyclase
MLLAESNKKGYWSGGLSSSALSTATAVFALAAVDKKAYESYIDSGIEWLINNRNPDGGWGDTTKSKSNLSTTLLVYSAMTVSPQNQDVLDACENYIKKITDSLDPENIVKSVLKTYGTDRTFSIPILTMCALAGRLGEDGWKYLQGLPFELAMLPQKWFKWLNLPVVSYALPALIAIGQVGFYHHPPANPIPRIIRSRSRVKTLNVLADIQPDNGGFLEATPLTSFVLMSLANCGQKDHAASRKAVKFLLASQRTDGSWPIDTNLATWVSTMAVQALGPELISDTRQKFILAWLLNQQHRNIHPYTMADPGGWAWTDLPGGVPDADDTPGALMALRILDPDGKYSLDAVEAAISWLFGLQNRDGGIPTFCRGWGKLPFDKSCTDLTAHAIAAWAVWKPYIDKSLQASVSKAMHKGLNFLRKAQRPDGSWAPLWFGNEHVENMENPVYGTAKVLSHLTRMKSDELLPIKKTIKNGINWLLEVQKENGTWGGDKNAPVTIEETALALDAVASCAVLESFSDDSGEETKRSLLKGTEALTEMINKHDNLPASPIGLYFARLWYHEKLYPLIFSLSALRKVRQAVQK